VARITPLIDRYLSMVDIPTVGRQRVMDVCGGCPQVPAYLLGEPEHFATVRAVESESGPIRVVYDPTSSASVDAESLLKRGAAAAAFVLALSATRPVELWVTSSIDGSSVPMIRLGTSPFVTSEVAFAVGHVAFARQLIYGWGRVHTGYPGWWADWMSHGDPDVALRRAVEAQPDDVVLGPATQGSPSVKDPDGWLQDTVRRFKAQS